MKFEYNKINSLPPLSWLAIVKKQSEIITVVSGNMVECHDQFFVSGAWNGNFLEADFVNASSFQGTGAQLVKNERGGVIFATPNHLQESVYSIDKEDKCYFSNSVPFLLAYTNNELDKDYYGYEYDFNSIFFGSKRCVKKTKLKDGFLLMHRYCNIHVDSLLNISETSKNQSPKFASFEEYVEQMNIVLRDIINNAQDKSRKCRYKLVTTISKGYDASAASALVHDLGCDTALTFSSPQKYKEDSGVDVAKCLEYKNIIEGNGTAYMSNKELWEAECSSCGDVGGLVAFNTFEEHYKDSILFLGLKGDSIWGKHSKEANSDFDFYEMSIGAEQNPEHYLRNNTISISIPLILGDQWKTIYNIANSKEMEAYSVGGYYDRPVPRRIVEERGVPREYFGMKKSGAGFTYRFQPTLKSVKSKMSDYSYSSLCEFSKLVHRNSLKLLKAGIRYYGINYPYYVSFVAKRLGIKYHKKPKEYVPSVTSQLLILWGMDEMKKRYCKALNR